MVHFIQYQEKDNPSDEPKTMPIETDPETLTITSGFIGPNGNAWRVADVDRSGKKPIFTIFPQSRVPYNPADESTHK